MLGSWRGLERGGGEMGQSRSVMHKGTVVGGMWPFTKPWVAPDKRKVAWALSSLSAPDKPPPTHKQGCGHLQRLTCGHTPGFTILKLALLKRLIPSPITALDVGQQPTVGQVPGSACLR